MEILLSQKKNNTVEGVITGPNGKPVAYTTVVIYDIDMRNWQKLAEGKTDRKGKYKLLWTHGQLSGRGKKTGDIGVKVLGEDTEEVLYQSSMREVRFNASTREIINIQLTRTATPVKEEYSSLKKEIEGLSGKVKIEQLEQNEKQEDVVFLSRELEVPPQKIEHMVVAHRMGQQTKTDPEFFYGLLRKNTLLKAQNSSGVSMQLDITIQNDITLLVYDTALVSPEEIKADLAKAIEEKIINSKWARTSNAVLKKLEKYKKEAMAYYERELPKRAMETLIRFVEEGKIEEMQTLYEEKSKDFEGFLNQVGSSDFFDSNPKKQQEGKIQLAMGKVFGFGNTLVPELLKKHKVTSLQKVKTLARWNTAQWEKELKALEKGKKDATLLHSFAGSLARKFEKEFPTEAYAAQLEREKGKVFTNQKKMLQFLNKHKDFDLKTENLAVYLKKKKVANKEREAIETEMAGLQRIFKLVPQYKKTNALLGQNIRSSQQIVAYGKRKFTDEIALKANIDKKEAEEIYHRAETKHTAAMLLAGQLQDMAGGADIASFNGEAIAMKLESVSKDFPNMQSLFKGTDACSCSHCRSVYSPAAYLVELLQWVDKRSVSDFTVDPAVGSNAKEVLFARRPDLGNLDLSCENANTPVKYIDLVCELLEEAIAPEVGIDYIGDLAQGTDPLKGTIHPDLVLQLQGAGIPVTDNATIHETESVLTSPAYLPHYLRDTKTVCRIDWQVGSEYKVFPLRQTLSTAEALDAAPEYTNAQACAKLKTSNFAFELPFDLDHVQANAFLERFDLNQAKVMEQFQNTLIPENVTLAAALLGLTNAQLGLITTVAPLEADQQSFWNAPLGVNVVDHMKIVDHFLTATGISYVDLERLLALSFINPDQDLFVQHLDLTCDTNQKEIANLDLEALDRIHRFLRLQKVVNWDMDTLNEAITQANLGAGVLNAATIEILANLVRIKQKLNIATATLVGCFGKIPYNEDTALKVPLYQSIFQNKAKNGFVDTDLEPQKIDGTQLLSAKSENIAPCLKLKQTDLETLYALLSNGNLTMQNLSHLFASSLLVQKLKITPADLVEITTLSGVDFSSSPTALLQFIEQVMALQQANIGLEDMPYYLAHGGTDLANKHISEDKCTEILSLLETQFATIESDTLSVYDANLNVDEQATTFLAALSIFSGIQEAESKQLLAYVKGDWTSTAQAKSDVDAWLLEVNTSGIHTAIDNLDAAAPADIPAAQQAVMQSILDSIAKHNTSKAKKEAIAQCLSNNLKASLEVIQAVMPLAQMKKEAPGTDFAAALLEIEFTQPISPVHYAAQYDALAFWYKFLPWALSFSEDPFQLVWWLENNAALGWMELDGIPFKAGHAPVTTTEMVSFLTFIDWQTTFGNVQDPNDEAHIVSLNSVAEAVLEPKSKTELMQEMSILSGYEATDLEALDAHFYPVFSAANYQLPKAWNQLFNGAEMQRKLGATMDQIKSLLKKELLASDVSFLRTNLKSRYDESTWLSTLKQIMDVVRPQKRDALVAYLLATNPEIKTKNDLYDYFLVDTQMESCMPSSRIVQAHNSIQLFVQRALMGLEPTAIAEKEKDPEWVQWEWMKNYRVWEANRKVFLYPENWYDVSLSDDKSLQLTELINELKQNDINEVNVEQALIQYVEKLDGISFLEVMATWYDVKTKIMHVFARTKEEPSLYYYRRFEQERYWTPWEKVELDITGDHLLAFQRNNRLHLAWPVFSEETDMEQKSTIPSSAAGTEVENETPKRKLKIQLAISEYANKTWKPKRLSKDGVVTPGDPTNDPEKLDKTKYSLLFAEQADQVILFSTVWDDFDRPEINGQFNIAGCQGFPELYFQGNKAMPDFFPDFKDAELKSNRYHEITSLAPDDLSVKTGLSFFDFYELLAKTPGKFRISYPHQFTSIDKIVLLIEYFIALLYRLSKKDQRFQFKIPLGTMLPYFKENNHQAYTIIPGFYHKETDADGNVEFSDKQKRTASNIFQLLEDISNWFTSIKTSFKENPPADTSEAIDRIINDPKLHAILQEMSQYEVFDFLFTLLIAVTGSGEFNAMLRDLKANKGLVYGEQFKNMYHPLICHLKSVLYKEGIEGLMKRETQLYATPFDFEKEMAPNENLVPKNQGRDTEGNAIVQYPVEDLEFLSDGSYSSYNWDLFFRIPLHIATRLTENKKFESALKWFHYMFNPTGALSGDGAQKYWVTKPFYLNQDAEYINQRIDTLLYNVSDPTHSDIKELEFAIDQWRNKPFKPDAIARFRPVAYQKAVLMKYIDNLTEWGDYLFRQDTMESIAQATQMYVMADKLLGPKPRTITAPVPMPNETYNQMERKLDSFGNALIDLENMLPDLSVLPGGDAALPAPPVTLSTLYFCIPKNTVMLGYWDKIADRLFKIRNCQNIDGIERSLALFAPPIDPGALVKAAASGGGIGAILANMSAPAPFYRFEVLAQRAVEFTQEVRALGNALLAALEKKDAEAFALLKNDMEHTVLNSMTAMKEIQITESEEQIEILNRTKAVTEEKHAYYDEIERIIDNEQLQLDKLSEANDFSVAAQIVKTVAGALALIPEFHVGAAGFGGSPKVVMQLGGSAISKATNVGADILNILSSVATFESERAGLIAGHDRRFEEWQLQERLAEKEMDTIDAQIVAANLRKDMAEADLESHAVQIENAVQTQEFLEDKFTNEELYNWMIREISSVYTTAYQLAHDMAKKAERSYQYELGNQDSFIAFGYWDDLKKGLLSSNHLMADVNRMRSTYMDKNKREYEITKHVSLGQLDPLALIRLRNEGVCDFEVPEVLFDMDHPGQYFRRIKTVSISMPCIAGPQTSVGAKLSMVSNKYRNNTDADNLAGTGYVEDTDSDERFVYNVGTIQSIATSSGQQDDGLFELNFNDERYFPFEGKGAIGTWRLELPSEIRQFNYHTIADIVLHVKYTAREGGSGLKALANAQLQNQLLSMQQALSKTGYHSSINLAHEMPNEWHILKNSGTGTVALTIAQSRLPYLAQTLGATIAEVVFIARVNGNPSSFTITIDSNPDLILAREDDWKVCRGTSTAIALDTSFTLAIDPTDVTQLEEMSMVIKYAF